MGVGSILSAFANSAIDLYLSVGLIIGTIFKSFFSPIDEIKFWNPVRIKVSFMLEKNGHLEFD